MRRQTGRPFTPDEIRERQRRLGEILAQQGISAVIASSFAGSYYLSGSPIYEFGRPVATVAAASGEAVLIASIIERGHVEAQATVDRVRYYYDNGLTAASEQPIPPMESFTALLSEELVALGLRHDRVGFEERAVPVQMFNRWKECFPDNALVPVSTILSQDRAVLSASELALVREADRIADQGETALLEALGEGATAREADGVARRRMLEELQGRRPIAPFALRIGTGMGDPTLGAGHSEWLLWRGDERPQAGQVLTTGIDVLLWGYGGNVERTVAVEPLSERVVRDFQTMIAACNAGAAAARVGNTLGDVDRACKSVLKEAGRETRSGSGLGRGIVSWEGNVRDPEMDVRLYSNRQLEAGMAFSIEPDIQTVDGIFRHCNTVIITESGPLVDSTVDDGILRIDPWGSKGSGLYE